MVGCGTAEWNAPFATRLQRAAAERCAHLPPPRPCSPAHLRLGCMPTRSPGPLPPPMQPAPRPAGSGRLLSDLPPPHAGGLGECRGGSGSTCRVLGRCATATSGLRGGRAKVAHALQGWPTALHSNPNRVAHTVCRALAASRRRRRWAEGRQPRCSWVAGFGERTAVPAAMRMRQARPPAALPPARRAAAGIARGARRPLPPAAPPCGQMLDFCGQNSVTCDIELIKIDEVNQAMVRCSWPAPRGCSRLPAGRAAHRALQRPVPLGWPLG